MPWIIEIGAAVAATGGVIALLALLPKSSFVVKWISLDGPAMEESFGEESAALEFAKKLVSENLSKGYVLLSYRKDSKVQRVEVLKKGEAF